MAKTPKPDKNKGTLSHEACGMYPNCEQSPSGCLLQMMSKKKKGEFGKNKPKKVK